MKLDSADPELKELANQLFTVSEWLTGSTTVYQEGSGWYKCGKPILAWFYVVGPRARKHPPNSILVTATKSSAALEESSQKLGNNMYGSNTPEFVARPNDAVNFAEFLEFIGRAYKARNSD